MAIEDKKYNRIHGKDGGNKDGMKSKFDSNMHSIVVDYPDDWPELAAIVYQIGQLEEEIDSLSTRSSIIENEMRTIMSDHSGFNDALKELGLSGYSDKRQYGNYGGQ